MMPRPFDSNWRGAQARHGTSSGRATTWIAGGALIDEVLKGPPASPETLKRFKYPAQ